MAGDADLADPEAREPREVEQLHVERKAVERQVRRERRHRIRTQHLVAALRVGDAGHREEAHQRVEHTSADAPAPRFTGPLRARRFARSDDNLRGIALRRGVEKPREVVPWHREVRVRHKDPLTARGEKTLTDGRALPAMRRVDEANPIVVPGRLAHDARGLIRAAVVDDDRFPREARPIDVGVYALDEAADDGFFVVRGHDDREERDARPPRQWYTQRFVQTPAPERRAPSAVEGRASAYAHLLILLALGALFFWLFSRFFLRPLYLAESDLYENGLPIFLSPIWKWSSFEFSGLPVLADPANFNFYAPNVLFGELLHSWTAVVMSGPLLAACFTYAYVFSTTRSKMAAVFSALAFGLSEDMLERLRHINHVHAIAWLPLIVLALDRVRLPAVARSAKAGGGHRRCWIAIGAFAVGSCILAGHPQPALYVMYCAGLYAFVGIVIERVAADTANQAAFAATAAMFAVGIILSAVKAFPLIEACTLVVRSEGLTFERFVGPSLTGAQMFSFLFPTILHEPTTELPTYVGLATLILALIGATRLRSNWRVGFWLVMSLLGLGMALGTTTPLVSVAYYVPLYSWFRNLSRHMFLFAFGVSVLAGFGLAAFERREVSLRGLRPAAATIAIAMVIGAVLIRAFPASFPLEGPHGEPGPGPLSMFTIGVWIQFAILAAVIVVMAWMVKSPSQVAPALLMAILVVDLLSALPVRHQA